MIIQLELEISLTLNVLFVLHSLGCQIYGFVGVFSGTSSICMLAAVAFERYHAITRPFQPAKKLTHFWAYKIILFIWLYSLIFASLPLLTGVAKYAPEGYLISCGLDYLSDNTGTGIFILSYFVGAWVAPLVLIVFCYTSIIRTAFRFGIDNQSAELPARDGQQRHRWSDLLVGLFPIEVEADQVGTGTDETCSIASTTYQWQRSKIKFQII